MDMTTSRYQKLFVSLRYWLIGMSQADPAFLNPLKSLEYAKNFHIGVRKDGKTPEFQHQIEIAHYLRTLLPSISRPAETLACVFIHDTREDYNVSLEEIERLFGPTVAHATELLSKTYRGDKKTPQQYFDAMAHSPIASIIKGADRINNHQSMSGVFSIAKQKEYIEETKEFIIPMLKKARHLHPEQESIYENIKYVLNSQMQFVELLIADSTD